VNLDPEQALRFLRLLERDGGFMLQTFNDIPDSPDHELARVIPWPANDVARQRQAWAEVSGLYARGAGVYCAVNRTDGTGRKKENITSIRGVFRENDGDGKNPLPLDPSITVESSPGHFHEYVLAADAWPADQQGIADFTSVMERMIASHGSCKGAKDISRVLRVPGCLHRKNPEKPWLVRIVAEPGWRYPRTQILEKFPPVIKECAPPIVVAPGGGNPSVRVRAIVNVAANAKKGDRNCLVYWSAKRLRELAVLGELDKSEFNQACHALVRAGVSAGLPAYEVQRTIKSAFRK